MKPYKLILTLGKVFASIRNIDSARIKREAAHASQERNAPVLEHRRAPDQRRLTRSRQPWLSHKLAVSHSGRKVIRHIAAGREPSLLPILAIRLPGVNPSFTRHLMRRWAGSI